MYLLYVDESGDTGMHAGSPTSHYVLSGLVLHELRWASTLQAIIDFRRQLRAQYGLKLREEVHAGDFLNKPGTFQRIPKSIRLRILRDILDFQASLPDVNVLNVVITKAGKAVGYDCFDWGWRTLIQRFHNTIAYKNFPGPKNPDDLGLLIVDQTDEKRLRGLSRRMRRYNMVPSKVGTAPRQILITTLVEDAVHRDSGHSYFIQLADVNAYFLKQQLAPSSYVRRKGGTNYFDRLDPVLCKVASTSDPKGIVRL